MVAVYKNDIFRIYSEFWLRNSVFPQLLTDSSICLHAGVGVCIVDMFPEKQNGFIIVFERKLLFRQNSNIEIRNSKQIQNSNV